MSQGTISSAYTSGVPHRVDLDQVEPLLRSLWEEAEQTPGDEPAPLLKVRTLNLVVYVASPDDLGRLRGSLAEISAAHPGRVMILCPDPQTPPNQISAQATVYCYLARHGRQHVCGEEITLTAQGEALAQMHTAVLSLRLSELPVVLWWDGEPPLQESRFAALADTADRLIIDSASFSQPLAQLQRTVSFIQSRRGDLALSDLNWTRITPWRELIAQFYDDREALVTLDALSEVSIEYGSGPGGLGQALLLLGWLSSRLGWKASSGRRLERGTALTLTADERQITVTLRPTSPSGGLRRVQLGGGATSFAVACSQETGMAHVEIRLPQRDPVSSKRRLQPESLASLMRRELAVTCNDTVFEGAFQQAGRLATLLD